MSKRLDLQLLGQFDQYLDDLDKSMFPMDSTQRGLLMDLARDQGVPFIESVQEVR